MEDNKMDCKEIEFKKPKVKLVGTDGNAYAILAKIRKALRECGQLDKVEKFTKEATSGDYDHLIQTCFKYANIEWIYFKLKKGM